MGLTNILWLLATFIAAATQPTAAKPPNVVIFFGDGALPRPHVAPLVPTSFSAVACSTDWGYGDLGANDPEAKGLTPHLDELAANGIRFTDFHVGSSVCVPLTAAALLRQSVRTTLAQPRRRLSVCVTPSQQTARL